MKTVLFFPIAISLVLVIAGCGTTVNVTKDYDHNTNFTTYKTFSLYDIKSKEGQVSQLNADRIANSIRTQMIAKGFTENSNNPDLMINAVTILKNKTDVTASTNYYGYGGLYRPYGYWGVGMASGSTTYSTYNYKDGSLIIDVVDSKTQKLIWEGTGNAEIDKAPKNPDEFIADAVKKILAEFPPK